MYVLIRPTLFVKVETKKNCFLNLLSKGLYTLASGIDVWQGINVGPGKFVKKKKRRALNTHYTCSM